MPLSEVAGYFESLGGGSLNDNGWAFGCEFGFFQRECGIEPLGLLRWASVAPDPLIGALVAEFEGIDDPSALAMREHTAWDWGCTQTTYSIYMDHTNIRRAEISADKARKQVCRALAFLRRKLLNDLRAGEKIFVYRTYDHTISEETLLKLSAAVNRYGENILLYVRLAGRDEPCFNVERMASGLAVATIDHFAPRDGNLVYNNTGWEAICRTALRVLKGL